MGSPQYNRSVMRIYETYSKRLKKRKQAGQPDVYQYDELPQPLRVQIIHIWDDAIGRSDDYSGSTKALGLHTQHLGPRDGCVRANR